MRHSHALLLALPLLAAILWFALRRDPAPAAPLAAPAPAEQRADPAAPLAIEAPAAAPERGKVEAAVVPAAAPASTVPAADGRAELRGRFVLENAAPAAGTKLQVSGWEANSERVLKFGRPKDWKPIEAQCDADGRFSIRFDPPRAYQFVLEATYPGCVKASWRWGELEPATTKDLGETTLPRGGTLVGRVLDAQGKPTQDTWYVDADSTGGPIGKGGETVRAYSQADKATGQFRIEGVPAGKAVLSASSEMTNQVEGPTVEVRAGETTEADIRYSGPDNSRRIVVQLSTRPFYSFGRDAEITLLAPGREARKAQKIARSASSSSFDDLDPGSYSLTVEDPLFKPWRQDGVQPGQRVRAQLQGASAVRLTVLDAATRAPLAHYALRVRFDHVSFRPNQVEILGAESDPPAGGLVEGLIPVEQVLVVVAEGYAPCELKLEGLKAGEVRVLTAELGAGTTLFARVLEADGKTPLAGATVTLGPEAASESDRDQRQRVLLGVKEGVREATSAADGSASFSAVAPGKYTLRSERTPLLAAEVRGVEVSATDRRKQVDLVLPANGWLLGNMRGCEPATLAGCTLVVLSNELGQQERGVLQARLSFHTDTPQNPIASDGSFRAGPLRAGKSTVHLQYPKVTVEDGPDSRWSQPGAAIDLGELEIPAGGELRQDFDLSGKLPGFVEASVLVNGLSAAGVRVTVAPKAKGQSMSFALDAQGHGRSQPTAPGNVGIELGANDGSWSWSPPGSWTIASGETLRVQWDVPLVAGTLQLVDAESGQPLADKQVSILPEGEAFSGWMQRTSDKQGKLELRLVPAAYRLDFPFDMRIDGKPGKSPFQAARFDWTASGPSSAIVKIAKKP